jgi:tetratricopeptide (TPR) repeat protein
MSSRKKARAAIPGQLSLAVKHHRAGELRQAERLYRQVLQADPRQAEAMHLLGLVTYQLGDSDRAVEHMSRSLRLQPGNAEAHNNLGVVLRARGKPAEAEARYREALRLRPDYAEALNNLSNVLRMQGKPAEAAACSERAVRLRPDYAEAHNGLALARVEQGKVEEAVACFREALRLRPDYAEAHNSLGIVLMGQGKVKEAEACYREAVRLKRDYAEAFNSLGCALRSQGRLDETAACLREALRLQPNYPEAHNNLGLVCQDQGKFDEAMACYDQALRLRSDFPDPYNNRGLALQDQGRLEEAEACYREALRLRPDFPEALNNLGLVHTDQARVDEALVCYEHSLRLKPDLADARLNRALTWMQQGDFLRGWPEYEARWHTKGRTPPVVSRPAWDGGPLGGRTVLLLSEQGLGDTLQFVRYAPVIKQRGGRVALLCQDGLLPLLSRTPGLDVLAGQSGPPPLCDCWAPLLSMPRLLGTTLQTVPAAVPYLFADPARVARWGQELAARPGFRVGIAWQGNPQFPKDRFRSIPLRHFAPLAAVPGVRLLALQKGPGREQLPEAAALFPLEDLGPRLDEQGGAFMDTAAVLMSLDLVITSDSAVAHLAGGLGVPTWLPLGRAADWRWLLGREDSPWYPTLRLFRQAKVGDWPGLFQRLAGELQQLVAAAPRDKGITVSVGPGDVLDWIAAREVEAECPDDPARVRRLRREVEELRAALAQGLAVSDALRALAAELRQAHADLRQAEDGMRQCEAGGDFGPRFVELARLACRQRDRRAALRRQIDDLAGR